MKTTTKRAVRTTKRVMAEARATLANPSATADEKRSAEIVVDECEKNLAAML